MTEISLEMLQTLMRQMLDEQRAARKEAADVRGLVLALTEQVRRVDRRMGELDRRMSELDRRMGEMRDDIEIMLKAEIMGRLGNAELKADARLDDLENRLAGLETRQNSEH